MSGVHPPTKSLRIPLELSDKIIDYALEGSPTVHTDAASLSLSHPQFQHRAQGVLIADIHISHRSRCRNPIRFFAHSPHLIPYVRTIRLRNDKDQWQDQFPVIITMLTTGEGHAKKIILEHVTVRELLEVGANWEPFLDATLSDCVFTFSHCFQWIKELQNLRTLTFSREHPSTCCQDLGTIESTPLPFLDTLMYHPEASSINISVDKRFFGCVSGMCQRLRCLEITASESDINGVHGILDAGRATLESLKLRIMGWPSNRIPPCFLLRGCSSLQSLSFDVDEGYTARMTSSLDTLGVNNVLASIHIDMTIVRFYTRPCEWEEFFDVIWDRRGFLMLETCLIRLRCFCNTHNYLSTHSSTTEHTIQTLINRHVRAGDPQIVVT
ncbi:uncharacterized protein ARMOST_16169 [Armillaria ostoyae]|uniref:F-box domain-containing protein n=1 Tax=Armillaria ostoyae TaxID=47428 RepID=A0A284RVE7_ARMOS|nr:uncharacterized protein ARMOST_16169 [Armillaria ostoyae]